MCSSDLSNLPQEKQQEVVGRFDKMMSALIARQPDNLEIGDRLSEQARQYGIFARSIMDHAYGTQVMAQGGPEAETAAEALRALGPEGQQYIDAMEQDLRMAINESKQLQANKDVIAAYQSIKSKSSKGGIRMGGFARRLLIALDRGEVVDPPLAELAALDDRADGLVERPPEPRGHRRR